MFRSTLTAVQLKEDLLLDNEPKFFVSYKIAQYLLNHQLNGIRFMFRHYRNAKSAILNDIDGAGKCFQCVAFFDAIFRSAPGSHILVICKRKEDLDHWHYHIDGLLDNLTVSVADEQRESQIGQSTSGLNKITLVSSAYALEHMNQINAKSYIYLVLHDPHMQLTAASFARLMEIQVSRKLVLCNRDIVENLSYFYEILKFCNRNDVLLVASSKTNRHLTEIEFKNKYGDDRSIPKRNQIFRQRNLLNACTDFYLRRVGSNLISHYPPIDAQVFRMNFEKWKDTVNSKTIQNVACTDSTVSETITEMLQTEIDNVNSQIDENSTSLLNTASIDLDDFDTQMSPLIYSDSDTEENDNDNNVNRNVIQSSSENSQQPSSIIACNQEHAAKNRFEAQRLKSTVTRKFFDKSSVNNNKRMNYKKLSVTINSTRSFNSRTKKLTNELSTSMKVDDDDDDDNERPCLMNERTRRRISSTSDVQIISDMSSPITLSSNSATGDNKSGKQLEKSKNEIETQFVIDEPSVSPDLFSSFNSTRTEIPDENRIKSNKPKTLQDLFGAPDECDEIDFSTHSNADVFEITKNNVFENILCSAKDRITPTIQPNNKNKKRPACTTVKCASNRNCLSGLRIVLPKLDEQQMERIRNDLQSQSNSQVIEIIEKPVDVIDLTNSQNDIDNLIDSDFIGRNIERTPERKQSLTPSTRSCLKRSSTCDDKKTIEKRRRIPLDDAGWISTKHSPSATGTPHSRRRIEKWLNRTKDSEISDQAVKASKPRNLCKEFKSRANNRKRRGCMSSTTYTQSPNIFSDPDD